MTIPRLRFPEFQNAPEWEVKKLDDVYKFLNTYSFSRSDLVTNGEIRNIHYGDIHTKLPAFVNVDLIELPFINKEISNLKIDFENFCQTGDLIFADASEDLEDVGKNVEIINNNNLRVVSGMHTIIARQKSNKLIFGFGGYLFKSHHVRKQIQNEAQGTKVFGISAKRLSKALLPIPSLPEQQKIADCLTSLDDLITTQNQKLTALKNHKTALMQQLFPAEGQTTPRLRFPEFQNTPEWEEKKLGDISDFIQGCGFPEKYQGNIKGDYPFYKVSDISNTALLGKEFITESKNHINSDIRFRLKAKIAPKGTIIFARIGEAIRLNRKVITTIPSIFDNNIAGLSCKSNNIYQKFLYYSFGMISLIDFSGGVVPAVTKTAIESISLFIPSLPEQQKIADCFTSLDDLITAQNQKLTTLKNHKTALMQQLFPASEAS